jgi:preprotein translocase subunit SecF
MSGRWQRLYRGETTINFYGRRNFGFFVSAALLLITVISLFAQGLNLGIDFKGGVAFEMAVNGKITADDARSILEDNKVEASSAKIQTLSSGADERIRIQLEVVEVQVEEAIREDLAKKVGIKSADVSIEKVSATWGRGITRDAVKALLIFLVLVSLFIAWRFEARMAVGALAAVVHDVGISVGVYSLTGLEVTPATVVAFLTILGFSLYDTIVVFDKVDENQRRFANVKISYADVVNISMNQTLMRSLNTTIAAVLPVLSLLVLGSGVFGAVALQEFAIALLVGMATGAYSSIFIASPVLGMLKERSAEYASMRGQISLGTEMAHVMATGAPLSRRARAVEPSSGTNAPLSAAVPAVEAILSHPPRPRKKSRK